MHLLAWLLHPSQPTTATIHYAIVTVALQKLSLFQAPQQILALSEEEEQDFVAQLLTALQGLLSTKEKVCFGKLPFNAKSHWCCIFYVHSLSRQGL